VFQNISHQGAVSETLVNQSGYLAVVPRRGVQKNLISKKKAIGKGVVLKESCPAINCWGETKKRRRICYNWPGLQLGHHHLERTEKRSLDNVKGKPLTSGAARRERNSHHRKRNPIVLPQRHFHFWGKVRLRGKSGPTNKAKAESQRESVNRETKKEKTTRKGREDLHDDKRTPKRIKPGLKIQVAHRAGDEEVRGSM